MQVSDFHEVCEKCENTGDDFHSCQYWLHETEYYGSAIHVRNYCKDHITGFELYDGRKEYVCDKCMKYVDLLRTEIGREYILEMMVHIKYVCNDSLKDFIECYDDEELSKDVRKFFQFLRDLHNPDVLADLTEIDMKAVHAWIMGC